MRNFSIEEIDVGDFSEFSKTISENDIYLYAGISGDFNPAHINQDYAEKTFFKSRIAHGLLSAGLISAAIANGLPGPGSIYVKQCLDFTGPVYIGDTITARVEAVELELEKNRLKMSTTCRNQKGKTVIDGYCIVSPPVKKAGG